MTKRIISFLLILILSVFCAFTAFAEGEVYYVFDEAGVIDDSEEITLIGKLKSLSDKSGVQIAAAAVTDFDGMASEDFADSYYNVGGYANDCVIFFYSVNDSEVYILTNGLATNAISEDDINGIFDAVTSDIKAGNVGTAFSVYADKANALIDIEINGAPFGYIKALIIALVIGFIVAFIVTGSMKGQLNTVRAQDRAANYQRAGSLSLINSTDYFLYSKVDRTAIQSSDSDSSGGRGGAGRKI